MEPDGDDPAFIAEGSITGIRLTVASNNEIVKAQPMNEEFPLKHPSQLSGNPALGLPLQLGRCDSCGASDLTKCEGHFGFIKLPVSIYHPSHVDELTKILNMICFSCLATEAKERGKGEQLQRVSTLHNICTSTCSLLQLDTESIDRCIDK